MLHLFCANRRTSKGQAMTFTDYVIIVVFLGMLAGLAWAVWGDWD
jgi:hypothetical protein